MTEFAITSSSSGSSTLLRPGVAAYAVHAPTHPAHLRRDQRAQVCRPEGGGLDGPMHRHARNAQRGIADSLRACHPLTVCARVYGSSICLSPAMPLYAMHRPSHARVSHSAPSTAVSPSETRRVLCGCFVRGPCQSIILATHCPTQTVLPGRGTRVAVAASAPGLGSPAPHLRRDWAHFRWSRHTSRLRGSR